MPGGLEELGAMVHCHIGTVITICKLPAATQWLVSVGTREDYHGQGCFRGMGRLRGGHQPALQTP